MTQINHNVGIPVSCAMLCERALEEKDGVYSMIRLFNKFNVSPDDLTEGPPFNTLPLRACVLLRLHTYKVESQAITLYVDLSGPIGMHTEKTKQPIVIVNSEDDPTAHITVQFKLHTNLPLVEGTWWVNIFWEDQEWIRVPFLVAATLSTPGAH